MKTLPAILVVMMLVGCAGTGAGGGAGMSGGASENSIEQWNKDHHNDPSDTYFGG